MTLIEHRNLVQRSDEWYALRCGKVTASSVGRLITTRTRSAMEYSCECGAFPGQLCIGKRGDHIKTLHPARADAARADTTPPELIAADSDDSRTLTTLLVTERVTGHVEPTYITFDMQRGIEQEPLATAVYSEHYAPVDTSVGFMVRTLDGIDLGYSPDGLVGEDGLLEVKCPRPTTHLRTILADEVPSQHIPQLQAGLLVSGREWIDFVSFCGGWPLYRKRVRADERWFDAILTAVQKFEQAATEMVAAYEAAVVGLPMTERVDYDAEIQVAA